MGAYGIGTTCALCGQNHPVRTDAIACADVAWRGHTPPAVSGYAATVLYYSTAGSHGGIPDALPDDIALLLLYPEA